MFANKIVLVTGGTGFVGQPLCRFLVHQGANVFVLTRQPRLAKPHITYIQDIKDIYGQKVDIVINLAGETIAQRWTEKNKQAIIHSRLQTTADIIEYIKQAPYKPQVFVSASAIGYYGTHDSTLFTEETPAASTQSFAHQLCAQWEDTAKKAENYGVRTVLLRIGAVLEKNGGILAKLLPPFYMGGGGPIGHGRQWLSWIDRDDLVRLIAHAINTPNLQGPVNAVAPHAVSNKEFSQTLAKTLHRPCLLATPAWVMRALFGQMATEIMLQGQHVVPQKALSSGFTFLYPHLSLSLAKILKKEKSHD